MFRIVAALGRKDNQAGLGYKDSMGIDRVMVIAALCLSAVGVAWECEEERWAAPPRLEDGLYRGTLTTDCQLEIDSTDLKVLFNSIRALLEGRGKVHGKPARIRLSGMSGWHYDVSHTIEDGSDSIFVHEDAFVVFEKRRLLYRTRSKSIRAEGMASYLRHVSFETVVTAPDAGNRVAISLRNSVAVEQPWYAISPIFKMIAKRISKDKFTHLQEQLLPYISKNL